MRCPTCANEVLDKMRFCPECGENLEKVRERMKPVCPECQTECDKGAKFCYNCGHRFAAVAPAPTVSAQNDSAIEFGAVFSGFNIDELSDKAEALGNEAVTSRQKAARESELSAFEYAEQGDGTYVITGLKNKMMLNATVPAGVVSIGNGAFEGTEVFSVTLPDGLMQIGNRAFKNCKNLSVINIPEALVLLGDEAFYGCELLDISLPEGLRRVGRDALAGTASHRKAELASWTVGSEHTFGSYPQSSENSKESIEWVVLKREENRALVISKHVLDSKKYNEKSPTNWGDCSLRKWLNSEFYNTAFTAAEKEKISTTELKSYYFCAEENLYSETKDKIFLLGYDVWCELLNAKYRDKEDAVAEKIINEYILKFTPTEYAIKKGFRLEDGEDGYDSAYYEDGMRDDDAPMFNSYWMRDLGEMDTPDFDSDELVSVIAYDTDYTANYPEWNGIGVRPCMWINL